jgi:cation diffusion facilitator family transporter
MLLHLGHDHAHEHEPAVSPVVSAALSPEAAGARRRAMGASLAVAVLMLGGKLAAYVLTGSTAILSDALESVIHLAATGIAAVSLWYASQPPDAQHPYGHGKIAYFSSGFEGALILLAGGGIVWAGVAALLAGPELERLGLGLLITAALGAVNLALGLYLIRTGRRTNAVVLVANGHHVLTDMWTSLGVLAGIALVWATGLEWLDPAVAILLGLNITWTAFGLMRTAYRGLMERVEPGETARVRDVLEAAQREGRIEGFHHLRHRRVNDQVWIEVHLLLPDALPLDEAHHRATAVEAALNGLFPRDVVQVTSHLEPASHEHPDSLGHDEVADSLSG